MITFLACALLAADPPKPNLSLPPGFDVTQIAGDDLVHDAFVMTVHPKGHIFVGGRGWLKILIDADGDGKAESAKTILEKPDLFPMGLWWTDKELLFVSDKGLQSLPMDGLAPTGPPALIAAVKAKGEHEAHAVKRGPDGWLYMMCGNMAGVDESWATDVNSPVKKPVAGCLVRISPDGKRRQVLCDGFRNAYDFDWNSAGDPFTYDSDNERCVSLPWYEGCRLYHMVAGANHGWMSPQKGEFWRKPPYYFDVAEPLADLGRGSPTGVVCYKHTAFPAKYRDGLFLLDWTFGKIYFASLTPSGASYDAKVEVFAKPIGDDGFAPVSAAVHPITGDLLVAIGGRGTRGAVYRIHYSGLKVGWVDAAKPTTNNEWPLDVLFESDFTDVLTAARRHSEALFLAPLPAAKQFQEEEIVRWGVAYRQRFRASNKMTARWNPSFPLAARWTFHDEARLVASGYFGDQRKHRGNVFEGYAFEPLAHSPTLKDWSNRKSTFFLDLPHNAVMGDNSRWKIAGSDLDSFRELKRCASFAFDLPSDRRNAYWSDLRIAGSLEEWSARWLDELPAEQSVPELAHTLICLARCPLPKDAAPKLAAALLSLDEKLEKSKAATDRNWPLRIGELHQALAERFPDLDSEMVKNPSFGRPAHALFASGKSFAKWRPQAAERMLEAWKKNPDADWNAEVVKLFAVLPADQARPVMAALWERRGLRDELTNYFARNATAADTGKLVEALNSARIENVDRALSGLEKLATANAGFNELGGLIGELVATAERTAAVPKSAVSKQAITFAGRLAGRPGASHDELLAWLKANHPAVHAKLERGGVDWPAFQVRMAKAPWGEGNADRGKRLYEKLGCNVCHAGSGLGPDLKGAAGRFSRDDLFRAIVDPSKDVSDRYRTTQVLTKSGSVRIGLVVYESVDGLMLQTSPSEMVRIPNDEIEEKRLTRTSMMPTGMLKDVSDRDLADLGAYLKALK